MISIIKLRLLRLRDDISVLALVTAMAFGLIAVMGGSFNEYHPSIMIVDEDKSEYSVKFIDELRKNKMFNFIEADMDKAVEEVEEGKIPAALLIKEGFNQDIESTDGVSLGLIKIKDDTLSFALKEMVAGIARKMSGGIKIADITADFISSYSTVTDRNEIKISSYNNVMESWEYKNPISVSSMVYKSGSDSGYDGMKHSMIGFTLFFSMYTMVFGIGTILNDRQYKTWQRMLISPVSKTSILGGSLIVTYFLGVLQLGVLILGGIFLFNMDWGSSISGILLITAAFVFSVTSLGLMLSGIVKTHAQLSSITPLVLTSTSMLGGCMWPLEIVNNKILLLLAELTPQKWAIQGMESIASHGMGFEAAVLPTIVLCAMGVIFFVVGIKTMKFE